MIIMQWDPMCNVNDPVLYFIFFVRVSWLIHLTRSRTVARLVDVRDLLGPLKHLEHSPSHLLLYYCSIEDCLGRVLTFEWEENERERESRSSSSFALDATHYPRLEN